MSVNNPKPILDLSTAQLDALGSLNAQGKHPEMYRYLKNQVDAALVAENNADSPRHKELGILSNWLENAAAINANDGSFKSEFVRAAVDEFSERRTGQQIDDGRFQAASDVMANKIFQGPACSGGSVTKRLPARARSDRVFGANGK
jgi:hypothetical protein